MDIDRLNEEVVRFQAPPGLRDDPALGVASGVLGAPLLTVKTTGDLWTPISLDRSYARRVQAAGYGDFLVQRAVRRAGHCKFTEQDEVLRALLDLTRWATEGVRPEGEDLTGDDLSGAGVRFTSPFDADDPLAPERPLAAAAAADRLAPVARGEVAHPLGPRTRPRVRDRPCAVPVAPAGPGAEPPADAERQRQRERRPGPAAAAAVGVVEADRAGGQQAGQDGERRGDGLEVAELQVDRAVAQLHAGDAPARAVAEAALEERIARDQRQRPHEGQPGDEAGLAAVAAVRDRAGHEEAEQGRPSRRPGRA